jgi:hypothetical protein
MNIDQFEEAVLWNDYPDWVNLLAKAVMLNKVSIKDGKITVKAFTEDEI